MNFNKSDTQVLLTIGTCKQSVLLEASFHCPEVAEHTAGAPHPKQESSSRIFIIQNGRFAPDVSLLLCSVY